MHWSCSFASFLGQLACTQGLVPPPAGCIFCSICSVKVKCSNNAVQAVGTVWAALSVVQPASSGSPSQVAGRGLRSRVDPPDPQAILRISPLGEAVLWHMHGPEGRRVQDQPSAALGNLRQGSLELTNSQDIVDLHICYVSSIDWCEAFFHYHEPWTARAAGDAGCPQVCSGGAGRMLWSWSLGLADDKATVSLLLLAANGPLV